MKKLALISVSDKNGIVNFAKKLIDFGYEILATGGTAKTISDAGLNYTGVEEYASFPEIFSGRVKTLQPKIFGGILMRRDNELDQKEAEANNVLPIDIVCVNLYPFPEVVKRDDISIGEKIENIDIGGPSLIRASAKNYKYVSVLTNPNQYDKFLTELSEGGIKLETREKLAAAAFAHTSYYDTLIADYFEKEFNIEKTAIRLNIPIKNELRYGENPHQKAFIAGDFYDYFDVIHGKELSYNNIVDLIAAVDLVNELEPISCAIIKHTNAAGAATGENVVDAYDKALSGDPVSAFGGIVAFNTKVDVATALKLNDIFLEIIVAPDYDDEALEILKKKKNRRLLKELKNDSENKYLIKNIPGGVIAQTIDNSKSGELKLDVVTELKPDSKQLEDLKFAWIICKHTKSNAIIYVKDKKLLGAGAGQMSRLDSSKIAVMKATEHKHDLTGAVAASDAFFPFADGLLAIAESGIVAVIQPGGSVRDDEVIAAANEKNISMIFTGIRNFKH
ncbi:MAG: bifunctional phosphoribosylaminoimidazolecarboxamide formyltransferase/IMP cyclohydrolase [Bacteroidetes bacterium]|nr:bifunctional phosphoribosylaminoimidazolecarboxamide formyltransferase/IMP cyclohydrolase [Bacteroidota bacterium]MBU1116296.1 bifunctional phosphoribosylaminoimidazolecarboxamide formyltransferase/IMP cyclohydrolase [Bacteroidota bacterium]MBU1797313.1 bifunctional phosphoribosylaminoimidazolecarboxamide formyltransferase/IMP cyclohydrolase [Bacteroidota bacterium]